MHVYTYIDMASKNISITQEAYEALLRQKKNKESFTETILRITTKSGKLADCFGAWKMTEEEEKTLRSELSEGWRIAQERTSSEMP